MYKSALASCMKTNTSSPPDSVSVLRVIIGFVSSNTQWRASGAALALLCALCLRATRRLTIVNDFVFSEHTAS